MTSSYEPPWTSLVLASAISFAVLVKLLSHISLTDSVVVSCPRTFTADHLALALLPSLLLQSVLLVTEHLLVHLSKYR